MYIEQIYTGCLAEAAYYIESKGEAAIIDPLREVSPYIDKANERGAKIKYVFETHFHADFVSGHVDLAKKAKAEIVFGPNAETTYNITKANDGDKFHIGDLEIEVLHTPGHTMESTTYLLKDENGKDYTIFTGDTLFIGDVGRPDLAVKSDLTKEDLAGHLYDSLRNKILPLANDILVYPAHGAGSACGKNMSKETFSTLGEQKESNYALQEMTKEAFIKEVTEGIAPPPQYFPKNVMLNKTGYANIENVIEKGKKALDVEDFKHLASKGALILDTRSQEAFVEKHIERSVFIGLDGSFATWVGALIEDLETPFILVVEEGREEEAVTRLARVGYDNAMGYLKGGIDAWEKAGEVTRSLQQISLADFAEKAKSKNINILDVRKPSEFEAEHVEGAENFPLDFINGAFKKLDTTKEYYVHCKGGYRSVIAHSILKKHGFNQLIDVEKGMDGILTTDAPITEFVCPSKAKAAQELKEA